MNTIEQNIPYFNFLVSPVSGEKAEKILEKINEYVIHISKLDSEEWLSLIIKKDTNLFSYKSPFDSINEIGSEVQDESNIHSLENLNTIRKEKDNYFAGSDGILARCNSIVKFIPITYDGTCEITISEDKSTATAKFFPASVKGKQLTENDVIQTIRKMNISVNLELLEINGALEFVKNSNEAFDDVVVARGKEPKLGTDGWTEYLFDTDRKTGPVIDENGNIDFHSLNLIESVSKDQKIGIYHPMVEGEDGYNLFGERLVPPKLKASKLPKGQYIYYAEEEPTHMLSKIDGHISLVRSEVIISNLYNIRGDVDFHTGNVISKGSLNITGNVKSGFNLDMSETIKIGGYVKNTIIKAGGDITIRGGFSGTGEGKITSGGNVTVRYVRNQTIYAQGDISAEKEVVEAKLFAKGSIKSASNNMLLIGGYSIASGDIIVKTLGHEYNIETIVKAGSDYDIAEQITKYDNVFIVMQRDLKELKNQISATLSNGVVSRLAKALMVKQQMMKKKFEILKNKRKELKDSASKPSGSKIIVSGKIYPGVEIYIDGYKFKVTEIMQSKIFSVSAKDEGIVVTNR